MKLNKRQIRIFLTAALLPAVCAGTLLWFSFSASADDPGDPDAGQPQTQPASAVVSPRVPASVEFAGSRVDLDRRDMYERFDRELTALAYSHGNMLLTIKRANRYFPEMAPILKRHGVPEDLLYLACIESWLNPRALSGAKAAGMWQLMPATAKQLGLEVNDAIDERYNLELATDAACRLLKQNLSRFGGKWESAAAAYNGGPAHISRELSAQLAESAYNLYLTEETSRYMFRLLAIKCILDNPAAYGFSLTADDLYHPVSYDVVEVNSTIDDLPAWAKQHGISYMELREHNPWLRDKMLPNKSGKTYRIRIPRPESLKRSGSDRTVYNPAWVTTVLPGANAADQ